MRDDIIEERQRKLALLRERGMDPYPAETARTHTIADVCAEFETLEQAQTTVILAGRAMSIRGQGALSFVDLYDGTGRFQAVLKGDELSEDVYEFFKEVVDQGDVVEVSGTLFTTKRGQQSVLVKEWRMLAKSMRPLPDEWYGIKDEDERYRKRYLDILLNKEMREMFEKRSKFWRTIRDFLYARGYIEVETPVLENVTGGAEARPFVTHHNALDIDVYLRISAGELWQKKLMVAGMPKVFEIGRIFRNEGMSNEHAQDYTQLEFYEAYADYHKGQAMIIELYRTIATEVFNTSTFTIRGMDVDLAREWEIYDFCAIITEHYGIDPLAASREDVHAALATADIAFSPDETDIGRGVDLLWKKVRKGIAGPGFLINVPVYLEPLAKRSAADPRVVERFQVILAGSEMGKGFSELNDPADQRERFLHQQALRDAGDDEAQMADMEFVEALEYGMPPTFGFGVSERLFSFLCDVSIREAQLFPLMRPNPFRMHAGATEFEIEGNAVSMQIKRKPESER
jgi:lysyl-tRNA synthetase, class II